MAAENKTQPNQAISSAAILPAQEKALFFERCWKVLIVGALYVWLFQEEILRVATRWKDPDESHGILIPFFSLYFIYQERHNIKRTVGKPSYVGLLMILASLAGYVYIGLVKNMFYGRQVMMIGLLGGVCLLLGGWRILKYTWLPVAYLIFAMPLPSRLYYQITFPMRMWASSAAAGVLNLLPNVFLEAKGVIIEGTHGANQVQLNVAEACSGMHLLMAFVALGVAMAYLERRPIVHRIILLVSTIPIAIFCNILRVTLTGLIYMYVGPEYTKGTPHTLLGLAMLGVAFGLYGLMAWVMNRLFINEEEVEGSVLVVKHKEGQA
ncbi:MAG: exosortase [Sedimentisphaerales bacterium]|nr:exosortase [Sedimentisphaerales bacterium]